MKNYLIAFAVLLSISAQSQDLIVKHQNGDIEAKVTSVNENSISFTYPGETVVNTIGKAAVYKIVFASGREESISDKVSITGDRGWENVIITNNPNDVVGLRRKGDVKAKAGGYWSMRTTKGSDKKATEKIKKEAAEMGGHVVFIQQHETNGRSFYKNPESIQSGAAYGY